MLSLRGHAILLDVTFYERKMIEVGWWMGKSWVGESKVGGWVRAGWVGQRWVGG